jgi:hypothetical protein
MRFLPAGPDIPDELVSAQEKGETIFVCGAGVSRGAGLPLFRGLVESVYRHLVRTGICMSQNAKACNPMVSYMANMTACCLERRQAVSGAPRNRGMRDRIRQGVRGAFNDIGARPDHPLRQ